MLENLISFVYGFAEIAAVVLAFAIVAVVAIRLFKRINH